MAIDSILENLELSNCRLNQLTDFNEQLLALKCQLQTLPSPTLGHQVTDKVDSLKYETNRLSNRVDQLMARNVSVITVP